MGWKGLTSFYKILQFAIFCPLQFYFAPAPVLCDFILLIHIIIFSG